MKKKKNCSVRTSIEICCRYNYGVIKNSTIKEVLCKNEWIFNDAWNFWTYTRHANAIQTPSNSTEPIIDDRYILFSSTIHDFNDWEDIIEWDEYGAWYAYNFPVETLKLKETLLLGSEWDLPIEETTNSPLTNYFSIGEEWQFIHNIRPDVFVVKKGEDVIIGSPDFYTAWLIKRNLK